MKCQILFSRRNKKNSSKLCLSPPPFRVGRHCFSPRCLSVTKSCLLYNLNTVQSIFTKLQNYKYQSTLDDVQSARTITLAFILFELFPLDSVTKLCLLYNLNTVQAIFTSYKYQSDTRTITLAFILFELFSLEFCWSQKRYPLYNFKTI